MGLCGRNGIVDVRSGVGVTGRGCRWIGKPPGVTGYGTRYVEVFFGIPKLPSLSWLELPVLSFSYRILPFFALLSF